MLCFVENFIGFLFVKKIDKIRADYKVAPVLYGHGIRDAFDTSTIWFSYEYN